MNKQKQILSIGRDSTIAQIDSQLYQRVKEYGEYHKFTFLILNKGEKKELEIGSSKVRLVGGGNIVTAFIKTLYVALKTAKGNKFDLVTTQDVLYAGVIGFLVSKIFSIPLYVQLHGDHLDNQRWFKSKIGKFNRVMNGVGKYILKRADGIRVVSGRLKDQIVKNYNLDAEQIISIPIGTDLSKFMTDNNIKRKRTILFAQRLIPEKCPLLFVSVTARILEKYSDMTVTIAGDGFLREEMESIYEKHGLSSRVTFLGAVDQSELTALYQSSICYLHTADWEGWGMPMIEALASGCPVVTTDTGCAGEAVIHNENGFVTPVNDEEALFAGVEKLVTDEKLWQRLSKQGIIEAQQWSFTTLARKNMEWYGSSEK